MGIDELKVIIQALAGLADGAKEGFIWWIVIEGALPKLLLALFGAGVIGTVIYVANLVARYNATAENSIAGIRRIAQLTQQPVSGAWFSPSEVGRVIDAVQRLINERDASK